MTNFLPEQSAIIESTENSLKVKAGAGTGKTTVLVGYAERRKSKRILLLSFNKAVQEEASLRFPKNVECRTINSVAYRTEGKKFGHKMEINLRVMNVAKLYGVSVGVAYGGITTLKKWLQSADQNIETRHAMEAEVPNDKQNLAILTANKLWEQMINADDVRVPMIHDGYLKLFQINGHELVGFDKVMLDEAQDTNPVTSAIVRSFGGGKILVGDGNQSIYVFRGAKNAMNDFNVKEYLLRTSFRFGQEIGDCANTVIKYAIGDTMRIVGGGKPSSVLSPGEAFKKTGISAVIARTNAFLIERAMQNISDGRSFYVVGGTSSLKLDLLMDAYRLYSGKTEEIFTPFLKQFDGWAHFEHTAEESQDPDLLSISRTVDKYRGDLPFVIAKVKQNCMSSGENVDEILTTGHKSKGLEFDHVTLGNDFAELCSSGQEGVDVQEANLIYVAITRAKKSLVLNADLNKYMQSPVKNSAVFNTEKTRARA